MFYIFNYLFLYSDSGESSVPSSLPSLLTALHTQLIDEEDQDLEEEHIVEIPSMSAGKNLMTTPTNVWWPKIWEYSF